MREEHTIKPRERKRHYVQFILSIRSWQDTPFPTTLSSTNLHGTYVDFKFYIFGLPNISLLFVRVAVNLSNITFIPECTKADTVRVHARYVLRYVQFVGIVGM